MTRQNVSKDELSKKEKTRESVMRLRSFTTGRRIIELLRVRERESGAYQAAKSDLEARKGFSGSKSGGLKADET